jgi:eukaryotic-like serine/threonine-protein kinase
MLGKTVSHYKVLEKLGQGGMGVVYKAFDSKLERTVAIKFLPSHIGSDEADKQRFINEAKAASSLDHSHICTVYAIDETDEGTLFIVMAYYEGIPLGDLIEKGPLPIGDLLNYSSQIAAGLQKAHGTGIVHRDLKPDNLLITDGDQVKIIDFGLAKAANQSLITKTGTTLGTAPYMSPEQAQGLNVDHRTDIWSLGVVLYEMITGQRPFKSEYESALVYSILNETPEPVTAIRTGVPMELERIVHKCLEKDPNNRYQHADELIVDLRKVERELTSGKQQSTSEVRSGSATGIITAKNPSKITRPILLAVAAMLIAIAGFYYITGEKPEVADLVQSIAVLPLENLSPDPDDAFFSAGMHEDIIIQLSKISGLQVIARSSVMGYEAGQRNIRNISGELGVNNILEGSVRRAADRVRVNVSLTDIRTNRTLWAETYDRNLTDIFSIQSEIAFEIARALETRLSDSEEELIGRQPTRITEAYELYLRAREQFNIPGTIGDNFINAERFLKRAVELDPEFAQAYALLSRVYSSKWWFNLDKSDQIRELSLSNAERAFTLVPDLAEAHVAMGYHYYHGYRNYTKALEHFNTALRYQPSNADILSAIGFVQRRLGNFDDSISNLEQALLLDPRNLTILFNNAQSKMVSRRHEEAESDFKKTLNLVPDADVLKVLITLNRILWKGDIEFVRAFFIDNPELMHRVTGDWIRLKFLIGDFDGIIQTVNTVPDELFEGNLFLYTRSFVLALTHHYSGNPDLAEGYYLEALNEYLEMPESLHDDPRYLSALGRIYAGLNMEREAIENGIKAVNNIVEIVDALEAPPYRNELAFIYSALQMPAEAVEVLRVLLSEPGYMTIPRLKIEPAWNSIRETPEFVQLMEDFGNQDNSLR